MGLKMTLPSDKNHMATTFTDAYWAVVELRYDFDTLTFTLACYPSREAKLLNGRRIKDPSISVFGSCEPIYSPELYSWTQILFISEVFPLGIPLGRDEQLKALYTYIKTYTGLPFEDVFEDAAEEKEPEPVVEPEPQIVEENEPIVEQGYYEGINTVSGENAEIDAHYFADSEETEGLPEEPTEETEEPESDVPELEPEAEPEPVYHNPMQL